MGLSRASELLYGAGQLFCLTVYQVEPETQLSWRLLARHIEERPGDAKLHRGGALSILLIQDLGVGTDDGNVYQASSVDISCQDYH